MVPIQHNDNTSHDKLKKNMLFCIVFLIIGPAIPLYIFWFSYCLYDSNLCNKLIGIIFEIYMYYLLLMILIGSICTIIISIIKCNNNN